METSRSEPVCIAANSIGEVFSEQCSLEDRVGGWQELEQFWGEEKQRLQEFDGQAKPLSNSLEEHLLYDDFINEPSPTESKGSSVQTEGLRTVRGKELNDIPTSYFIDGFEPHELIVIGTYVDKDITPGFQYKVRKILSDEYLFNGKALHLENVGLGYGKRITFKGDSLNENENYFWSDSRVHGFGFTLQTIHPESAFTIKDTTTGQEMGRVIINNSALSEDTELTTVVKDNGRVEKMIKVNFNCDVILSDSFIKQNIFAEDVAVQGMALVVRDGSAARAKIVAITPQNFIIDDCLLLPEE